MRIKGGFRSFLATLLLDLAAEAADLVLGNDGDLGAEDGVPLEPLMGLDVGEMGLDEEGTRLGGETGDLRVTRSPGIEMRRTGGLDVPGPAQGGPAIRVGRIGIPGGIG